EDAHGQPPGIPFWLGEAPGRTRELSQAVSELREDIEKRIKGSLQERKAEPAPNPSQEGNGRGADECLLPAREESGGVVPKFGSTASIPLLGGVRGGSMESRHGLAGTHRDQEALRLAEARSG